MIHSIYQEMFVQHLSEGISLLFCAFLDYFNEYVNIEYMKDNYLKVDLDE